jgi:hypothetical protein
MDASRSNLDSTLETAWHDPGKLPPLREWLGETRSETAQAQYAFIILKKHFGPAGIELKKDEVPASLWSFGWQFYLNVGDLLGKPEQASMLRNFFAEVVDFYEAISGKFFSSNLLEILEKFIDRDPPRSLLVSLLPEKALAKFDEMDEILDERHEADLERQSQMGY